MGGHMSKKPDLDLHHHNLEYTAAELTSYENECRNDPDLQSFDAALQDRTHRVINSLTLGGGGVEVKAFSVDSLKEATGCLLEMNQEVVKIILECKQDVWKNQGLFELVEEYFDNSLKTLDFCTALEKCLKRASDSQLFINVALKQFEDEDEDEAHPSKYLRTLEELRNFKSAGDPFTQEFFQMFKSVYKNQLLMLDKLEIHKNKLDKKLKSAKAWRKLSCIIFATAFATVLICSVVAAVVAAPPVAAALAAATSIPLGSMGKWFDSLWKNYQDALKGQKDVIRSMQAGNYIAIKDLDGIRVLVDRLEIQIESLLQTADFAIKEEDGVKFGIEEITKKLAVFMKSIEDLSEQADRCSRDIRRARTVVLQRIIKHPNS